MENLIDHNSINNIRLSKDLKEEFIINNNRKAKIKKVNIK
jgi:hypothetical protein